MTNKKYFLHRALLSIAQGQAASRNITTGQNFLFWSLHSWESNWYQNEGTAIRKQTICRDSLIRNVRYWKRAKFTQQVFLSPAMLRCGYSLPDLTSQDLSSAMSSCHEAFAVVGTRSYRAKQHFL